MKHAQQGTKIAVHQTLNWIATSNRGIAGNLGLRSHLALGSRMHSAPITLNEYPRWR
jgi:hypothetical protein